MPSFLSTLSLRRATNIRCISQRTTSNFYPRSPCGERPIKQEITILTVPISIHALLAESDGGNEGGENADNDFYPRSPCGERPQNFCVCVIQLIFLSTLSLRRATGKVRVVEPGLAFLSTLSLRRATLAGPSGPAFLFNFYPRSPCGERRLFIPSH